MRLFNKLKRLFTSRRGYVIIYDTIREKDGESNENYYGYFSSPAEARHLWESLTGKPGQWDKYFHVKLCRIVEDWE